MMRDILRWSYRRLFPRSAKRALALSIYDIERYEPIKLIDLPPGRCVLVLAPHADDETIGCGGTLCKYIAAGATVHVIVMTDGAKGDPELQQETDGHRRQQITNELVQQRKREALQAMQILGIANVSFLDAPDGALNSGDKRFTDKFAQLLIKIRPDVIFLPFISDRHPDHWETNSVLLAAAKYPELSWLNDVVCAGYEIWTPAYANSIVDITLHKTTKEQAINQYKSQIRHVDYAGGALSLNRFRAISSLLSGERYAEAFYIAPFARYAKIYNELRL